MRFLCSFVYLLFLSLLIWVSIFTVWILSYVRIYPASRRLMLWMFCEANCVSASLLVWPPQLWLRRSFWYSWRSDSCPRPPTLPRRAGEQQRWSRQNRWGHCWASGGQGERWVSLARQKQTAATFWTAKHISLTSSNIRGILLSCV